MDISIIDCKVLSIESKDYPTKVVRPFYSVFNKRGIKGDFGVEIPHWKNACLKCIEEL